jgi:hypothetical protein
MPIYISFFTFGSTAQFWALASSIKLSVSFQLLDLGQSAGLLGRVISSSQGLCYLPRVIVGGMNGFGKGNRSTRRKPALTPLCPPQIPLAGRRGGKPATNRFSYGAAIYISLFPVLPSGHIAELLDNIGIVIVL